ncbi:zinc-binding dehydrogenase [Paraliomyxa miuraensis]|uniref:zinc-binding dehydrogenase n=1 Tax=Paraliomyxa miuraensis TaxID=376150 RepID=UPI00224DF14A|nr:zinc-binding dehydrogenase [Paraliomyxa miuraensis]MCX4243249.1 zinc-binding dehydrogenase [Paraliomyxa miuraensis]
MVPLAPLAPLPVLDRTMRLRATSYARAAMLVEPESFVIQGVELPDLHPRSVRVRIQGCGVRGSELPLWEGRPWFRYPLPPGSPGLEAWGVVEAIGEEVDEVDEGDRVALLGTRAYATHDDVAVDRVVVLPPSLDEHPFPGESLGRAFSVLSRAGIEPGQQVAIVGVGFVGAVLVSLCRAAGAQVLALAGRTSSMAMAEWMGANALISMKDHGRMMREVSALTRGRLCDRVIECAGAREPLRLAAAITGHGGRLVVAGEHNDFPWQLGVSRWNERGVEVVGALGGDDERRVEHMRLAVAAVAEGRLVPFDLVTHAFELEDIDEAFALTRAQPEGFTKAIVTHAS